MGPLNVTKFFAIAAISNYCGQVVFHPNTFIGSLRLGAYSPTKVYAFLDDNSWCGADMMSGSVFFMILFYHKYYMVALPFFLFDLANYGPMTVPMAGCALATATVLL